MIASVGGSVGGLGGNDCQLNCNEEKAELDTTHVFVDDCKC